uniref:Uncharacterized protein n=1 Tax=Arundo donax TaxID=35708 RepID=A0A0A9CI50_ARUDO
MTHMMILVLFVVMVATCCAVIAVLQLFTWIAWELRCPLEIGIVAAVHVGSVVLPKKRHHLFPSYFLACNVQGNITKLVELELRGTLFVPNSVPRLIAFAVQDVERFIND